MKKLYFFLFGATLLTVFLNACYTINKTNLTYYIARHYYCIEDNASLRTPLITSQQTFDRLFQGAPVKGYNGEPTAIDFKREFVIAVTMPPSDKDIRIIPECIEADSKTLYLKYHTISMLREVPMSTRPLLLLVVNRKYLRKKCHLICTTP